MQKGEEKKKEMSDESEEKRTEGIKGGRRKWGREGQ